MIKSAIAGSVFREFGRTGTFNFTTGPTADIRIGTAVDAAWRRLQALPFNWRWRKATIQVALAAADSDYTGGSTPAVEKWRINDDRRGYAPWAKKASDTSNSWDLTFMPLDQFMRNFRRQPQPAAGAPQFWTVLPNNSVAYGPIPNAADYTATHEVTKAATALETSSSTPDMPERHHEILVWMALSDVAVQAGKPEIVARANDHYEASLDALIADQAEKIEIAWGP